MFVLEVVLLLCFCLAAYSMQKSDSDLNELWPRLKHKLPRFFEGLVIKPSLLHGDLWAGNAAQTSSGPGQCLFVLETIRLYLTFSVVAGRGNCLHSCSSLICCLVRKVHKQLAGTLWVTIRCQKLTRFVN